MKIKTSELTGAALDWAVAECEGTTKGKAVEMFPQWHRLGYENYSTNWAQGGPIIEREGVSIWPFDDVTWKAQNMFASGVDQEVFEGPTPLIATMRCYVASKLGDEVDVPEELK